MKGRGPEARPEEKPAGLSRRAFRLGLAYELQDPRHLIDTANLLKAGYRLSRLAYEEIR